MALPPKVCPECESEYLHTAISCAHCGVALVDPSEVLAAPTRELPPASELSLVRAAGMGWVVALSERLVEAEIPHRVDPIGNGDGESPGAAGPYGVFVREQDLTAAKRIDADHLAHEMPDADFEATAQGAVDDDACPACGDPIAEGDAECGGCGLAFGPAGAAE